MYFTNEDIPEFEGLAEDVCGAPLQEKILSHQGASPNEKEREEGNVIKMPKNP